MMQGWTDTGIRWRGEPVYRNDSNGDLAIEHAGDRLVSLEDRWQNVIRQILLIDQMFKRLSPEQFRRAKEKMD